MTVISGTSLIVRTAALRMKKLRTWLLQENVDLLFIKNSSSFKCHLKYQKYVYTYVIHILHVSD